MTLHANRFDRALKLVGPVPSVAAVAAEDGSDILFLRPGSTFRRDRLAGLIAPA